MDYQTISYAVEDQIATITLNRPDKLNAFTNRMMEEVIDAIDRVDADDTVRAVIFTGAGRAYCAGADLSAGASAFDVDGVVNPDGSLNYASEAARDGGGRITLRLLQCLKPMIAAINGPAVGIGVTMTLPMDIRIASDTARFGFVFARRGIVNEAASAYFLPRVVGLSQALEWCTTGRVFDAAEALAGGLVRSVHAPDELLPAARVLAREIADHTSPVSVALIRQMLWRGVDMSHPMEAHKLDSRAILSRGRSRDVAEGVSAFFEKRPARFPDRVSRDMPDFYPWWEEPSYD
ncbi:crotonase/enoyl-CoA hydratase family protein (plasmid) [Sphingobium sp. JS3065]|uniref:crotonase/enoyl-CoA hydratase family protein n=1 Tax=Sphingobium sp. JS3065 TaxID=2970925 RepID=UPI002264FBB5|nr:crotonase/enoyl-CoA hydratase family protein [Sphingobium sp. JS3065]UZW58271.1 crotonase/enoyl-CoA hydratase family protein [Sphingobium sp. JS3065]